LGATLAFLLVRTDLPGSQWIEPLALVPIFLSPIVVAFGYVVAIGPVGFISLAVKSWIGTVPWDLYGLPALVAIAALTHVPHSCLYVATALRSINPELEEAARTAGAPPWRVAIEVSLPLARPAILYAAALTFLLGFELFGLPLVLGDSAGLLVMTTYLFKLTTLLGVPSYQMMAVVAISIVAVTFPLVLAQRHLLGQAARYATIRGRGLAPRRLRLGAWRWGAFAGVVAWFAVTVALPLGGIVLRSVVRNWGIGVDLGAVLTLDHFRALATYPNLVRGVIDTIAIATIGGAASVALYLAIGLAQHRWTGRGAAAIDFLVLLPRAVPGLIGGLAFLWVILFVPFLRPFRNSLGALWLAYTSVWLAYGLRLISTALLQVGAELEESARTTGASAARVTREITVPLARAGIVGSWLLVLMMFVREYSTGVYLMGPGTEVIGSLIVSLWGAGGLDLIAALSVVNVVIVCVGLSMALRLGVRLHA
jgi:iron(III) transport system permease protein